MSYQQNLDQVAASDVEGLKKAQKSYGDSWMKRGGVGAFMMLARKWDRLEVAMTKPGEADQYDLFGRTLADPRSEGIIDDIRDLRRYLLLVEAQLIELGVNPDHRDNACAHEWEYDDQPKLWICMRCGTKCGPVGDPHGPITAWDTEKGVQWPKTNATRQWDPDKDMATTTTCVHNWVQYSSSDNRSDCSHCSAQWFRTKALAPKVGVPRGYDLCGSGIIRKVGDMAADLAKKSEPRKCPALKDGLCSWEIYHGNVRCSTCLGSRLSSGK